MMKTLKSKENEAQVSKIGNYYKAFCQGLAVRGGNNNALPNVMTRQEMEKELSEMFDSTIARQFMAWSKQKKAQQKEVTK